jgi:hypothetical protein
VTVKETIRVKHGKGTRSKAVTVTSPLIEIAIESEDDASGIIALPLGNDMPAVLPYAFRVGLGDWAKVFLDVDRARIMPLMKTLASYDPKDGAERIALRLAIKLSCRWNTLADPHGRAKQHWTFGELIEAARVAEPKHNPARFREYVESALDRLTQDRVIGGWCEDPETVAEPLPARGWLPKWLLRAILISPPENIRAFYSNSVLT